MSIERKMFHITQIGVVLLRSRFALACSTCTTYLAWKISQGCALYRGVVCLYCAAVGTYHEGWRGRRVVWFNVAGAVI